MARAACGRMEKRHAVGRRACMGILLYSSQHGADAGQLACGWGVGALLDSPPACLLLLPGLHSACTSDLSVPGVLSVMFSLSTGRRLILFSVHTSTADYSVWHLLLEITRDYQQAGSPPDPHISPQPDAHCCWVDIRRGMRQEIAAYLLASFLSLPGILQPLPLRPPPLVRVAAQRPPFPPGGDLGLGQLLGSC